MRLHLSTETLIQKGANWYINSQHPGVTEARRAQILPATKYNLLVQAFNASTVLLIIAVASTILLSFTAAFVFGSIAVFTRVSVEREIPNYVISQPRREEVAPAPRAGVLAAAQAFIASFGRQRQQDVATGVLQEDWVDNEVIIADYPLWKNPVPLPPEAAAVAS